MDRNIHTIQVLMATYNGSGYLRQQLDSILKQKGVEISLLVRDDGSTDGTLCILRSYEKVNRNISVYTGKRKGAAGSFFDLLLHADPDCGYYAFADQDDVWRADKLLRAVSLLERESSGGPLLYAGRVIYAAEDLGERHAASYRIRRGASFGNALMENICMGCTEVFNRELLLLARGHLPDGSVMHDWWMYLTASYFGNVVYDQKACILYRQHRNNTVGMQNRWGRRWLARFQNLKNKRRRLSDQAVKFRDAYAGLVQDDRLDLLCTDPNDIHGRLRILWEAGLYRQYALDDILCRILLAAGYL